MSLSLLVNPTSGNAPGSVPGLLALAESSGAEVHVTYSADELTARVGARASDPEAVIAIAGGDGTFSAAVTALLRATPGANADQRAAMLLIPTGTANDLANALDIPQACEDAWFVAASEASPTPIDVLKVRIEGTVRWAVNAVVSSPAVQAFNDALSEESKQRWGASSYALKAFTAVSGLCAIPYRLTAALDGTYVTDDVTEAFGVVVGNGETATGGIPVGPSDNLTDGAFEIRVLDDASLLSLARTASRMVSRTTWSASEDVTCLRADHCRIEPVAGASPSRIDGEEVPAGPLEITLHPGAVRVMQA